MRTNTWLGLQMVQAQLNHGFMEDHLKRLDDAQAARDHVRDEKFDRAAAIAQRGQFAMWIQSPEGQIFDRWAPHAITASQQLADREAAWELAWYAEHQAGLSASSDRSLTTFGTDRPWDVHPWHRQLQGPQISVVARLIDDFARDATTTLPRPSDLIPLSGVYFTYSVNAAQTHGPLPSSHRELLEKFQTDDVRRVAALRADGFR